MAYNFDPDMSKVMNTLRILSHPSISRSKSGITSESHTRCVNCNGSIAVNRVVRSREDILRNLIQLEATLQSRGEKLPTWVQAYKQGDSIRAAKLLHLSYMASKMSAVSIKRKIVQEATSTTETMQEASQKNNSSKVAQDEFALSKRRRISEQ